MEKQDKIITITLYSIAILIMIFILLLIFVQPIKQLTYSDRQLTNIEIKLNIIQQEYNQISNNYISI